MKDLYNIKPSAFTRGAYVGYAAGCVWSIFNGTGEWVAIPRQSDSPEHIKSIRLHARTLTLLSASLESVTQQMWEPCPYHARDCA